MPPVQPDSPPAPTYWCERLPTSEALVEALRRKGKPVGYLLFSGEQHGFRKATTIQHCLDAELQFYAIEVFKISLTF